MPGLLDRMIIPSIAGYSTRPDIYCYGLSPGVYVNLCMRHARTRRKVGSIVVLDTRRADGYRARGKCKDCKGVRQLPLPEREPLVPAPASPA